MADNFFLDNADLQYYFNNADLREVVEVSEQGYSHRDRYPTAPRNYQDARDNYRILLEVLGDICANVVAPRAAEADEEGAQFHDGKVEYAQATQDAVKALQQAELMGVMLPWEYGGMNVPETIYQMMVEILSRAEAGLMTVFGLQEIASTIAEFGTEEMKERILPRFARGEVSGAMVLTEPDAGSDLGSVQTRATLGRGGRRLAPQRRQALHHQRLRRHPGRAGAQRGRQRRRARPVAVRGRARRDGADRAASRTRWAFTPRPPVSCSSTTRRRS